MGRSPVLVTLKVAVLRPALSSISPSWMNISPGIIGLLSPSKIRRCIDLLAMLRQVAEDLTMQIVQFSVEVVLKVRQPLPDIGWHRFDCVGKIAGVTPRRTRTCQPNGGFENVG